MRFGLGPLTIDQSSPGKKLVDVHEEALEHAAAAEWWGLDSVWADEDYFAEHNPNSSSSVVAAALAERTEFMRVGIMPVLGLVNPLYIAEEVACIDNISAGRSIVAAQVPSERACAAWGVEHSLDRTADDIEILRKAWSPNPFSHASRFHKIPMQNPVHVQAHGLDRISVQPNPAQLEVPLWVTGGEDAATVAAQVGAPFMGSAGYTLDELRPWYEKQAGGTGIAPLSREIFIAATDEAAWELAEGPVTALYKAYSRLDTTQPFEQLVRDRFVIGGPETCIEQLYRYQNELGVDYVLGRLSYHAMHHAETIAAIRYFGQAVIPEFRMFGLPAEIRKVAN
jgi:alkanesulfonate monooxygenase SsuD/methylene tetrahydromethanopterin reductase-like flavin-dependent oxidoreductase (luciferase family)